MNSNADTADIILVIQALGLRCDTSHLVYIGHADNILLMNLYREELSSWFREVLKIALASVRPADAPMPRIIDTRDLLHFPRPMWVAFENYIVVTDRCAHTVHEKLFLSTLSLLFVFWRVQSSGVGH